jgi:hypothetical protein
LIISKTRGLVAMFKYLNLLLTILTIAAIPISANAGTTGKIDGTVKDASTGEPLPGVNVILDGTTMGAATDLNGYYFILNVPPGIYSVKAMMIGYQGQTIQNLKVSVDMTSDLSFALTETVLDAGTEVTIVAERPIVQKDMTSSMASVGSDEIQAMPVQEIADVLELQAGLVRDGVGGIHVRGGRSGEVAYWVDGIAATDNYSGDMGVEVENASVQELQVISGTFNAEYGQAMSAIVNIVTKEGGQNYTGEISGYVGDYVSFDDDNFWVLEPNNTNDIRAIREPGEDEDGNSQYEKTNALRNLNPIYNLQGSLSGPVIGDKLTFFATARYFHNEGYLYGKRWFTPQGLLGDGELVSMNPFSKFSGQLKLAYRLTPSMKLTYGIMGNDNEFRWFDQYYKYNPDGNYKRFETGQNHILTLTHTLSASTFYEAKFTSFNSDYKHHVYKDALNSVSYDSVTTGTGEDAVTRYVINGDVGGYVHPDSLIAPSNYSFSDGGTQMQHFERSTKYFVGKFDVTSQVTRNHQIKAGVEGRFYDLSLNEFEIIPAKDGNDEIIPFKPSIPLRSTAQNNGYNYKPLEVAAYIQDKMEFEDMIVNFGLRFDYFNPKGKLLADPEDPNIYEPFKKDHIYKNYNSALPDSAQTPYSFAERDDFWWKDTEPKLQISPRFGIAYPITEQGVIHFSYGHFFQMPSFRVLYGANDGTDTSNPDLEVSKTSGNSTFLSNADLDPQKTVMYEIGLQQQITPELGIDITMFYRDVRDWIGASPLITTALPSVSYTKYENKDYSNVRGVTLAVNKRYSNYFEASLDYSFMVAEGSASNPKDAYFDRESNKSPRIQLVPLGWDQRHTLNGSVSVGTTSWRVSVIGRFWTGAPYTPEFAVGEVSGSSAFSGLAENSARKPNVSSMDLRVFKRIPVGNYGLSVFAYIYNLLDQRSPHNVFADTGSPYYTLGTRSASTDANRVSTLDDNTSHPDWYGEPRQIQVGVALNF